MLAFAFIVTGERSAQKRALMRFYPGVNILRSSYVLVSEIAVHGRVGVCQDRLRRGRTFVPSASGCIEL
jgi:hypothetical protein